LAEQLHAELQAEDRVRATEKDCAAVRIAIEDCAQLQRGSVGGAFVQYIVHQ
jgi:hypothetical protein